MAKHIHDGVLFSGKGLTGSHNALLHSHAGRLLGLIISHTETFSGSVTLYDATAATAGTEIAAFHVSAHETPFAVSFARDAGIPFSTGLYIATTTCDVLIWSVDYG